MGSPQGPGDALLCCDWGGLLLGSSHGRRALGGGVKMAPSFGIRRSPVTVLLIMLVFCLQTAPSVGREAGDEQHRPPASASAAAVAAAAAAAGGVTSGADIAVKRTPAEVRIAPPFIVFRKRPMCLAARESVVIENGFEDRELEFKSVVSNTAHFQVSNFSKMSLPPGGRSSFSVIFLPRELGMVHGHLKIETNAGMFEYGIQGEGVPNGYRVSPLVGVRIPSGRSYKPSVELYNPHDEPLRVTETFTNQGFLHLVFDNRRVGKTLGPNGEFWMIPPKETRQIVGFSFQSSAPGRHDGYVNVRTDKDDLVIPIELNVVNTGLHVVRATYAFNTPTIMSNFPIRPTLHPKGGE
jgi:hypothetical protein